MKRKQLKFLAGLERRREKKGIDQEDQEKSPDKEKKKRSR